MNLSIARDLAGLKHMTWPSAAGRNRPRILFLSSQVLGLRVFADQLEEATARHPEIDAVHVRLKAPRLLKFLGAGIRPWKGGLWHAVRHWMLWDCLMTRLLRQMPLERFDAIHVLNQYNAAAFGRLAAGIRRRVIACMDATSALEHREFGYSAFDRWPLVVAERCLLPRLGGVACWSEWCRRSVIEDCGVSRNKTALARLGIRPVAPRRQAGSAKIKKPLRIGFVGNHWLRKGGDRLLRWHQARWADRAELHVVGIAHPEISMTRGVIVHGVMAHEQLVSAFLPTLDLLILPTREDTCLLAALEAQAAGVPVVTSRMAGIATDIVRDGETGLLCNPESDADFVAAVERLMDDESMRQRMSDRCAEVTRSDWDPERCSRAYLSRVLDLAAAANVPG